MEPSDELLIALFAAWRGDIDSEPFAYELELECAIRTHRQLPACIRLGYCASPQSITCQHTYPGLPDDLAVASGRGVLGRYLPAGSCRFLAVRTARSSDSTTGVPGSAAGPSCGTTGTVC